MSVLLVACGAALGAGAASAQPAAPEPGSTARPAPRPDDATPPAPGPSAASTSEPVAPDPATDSAAGSAPADATPAPPPDDADREPGGALPPGAQRCLARPVTALRLTGCDASFCDQPGHRDGFASLTDIRPGTRLDAAHIQAAGERLVRTGFFRDVSIRCAPGDGLIATRDPDGAGRAAPDDGVIVEVAVTPNRFVRDVTIRGHKHFRESELQRRVFLRTGTVLNVTRGGEARDETVQRQIASLLRLYEREGLEDVRIRIEVEDVDRSAVDVAIVIEEGDFVRVRNIRARHVSARDGEPGAEGGRVGCPRIPEPRLRELVGLDVGDVVTAKARRDAVKRLERWFRSVGFVNPEATTELVGDPLAGELLRLDVTVRTERCWLIRVWTRDAEEAPEAATGPPWRWRDTVGAPGGLALDRQAGFAREDLEEWREVLPFAESGVFDPQEAARGVDGIRGALVGRGFSFAEVRLEHRALDRGGRGSKRTPVAGVIDYFVTHEHQRRVRSVTFEGLQSFDEETIRGEMATTPYDFLGQAGDFQVDKVLSDLRAIKRYYGQRGFHRFRYRIEGTSRDREPRRELVGRDLERVTWRHRYRDRGFEVWKEPSERDLNLRIAFDEGPRTMLGDIVVEGHAALSTPDVLELLGMTPGTPYGSLDVASGKEALERAYSRRGHALAEVVITCTAHGRDPVEAPSGDDQATRRGAEPPACELDGTPADRIDLRVRISEGPEVRVGEVFWRGGFQTEDEVMRRDLPEPGAPFDPRQLDEAARWLRNLGVFDSVKVEAIGLEESPPRERVAVVVSVGEASTKFLDLAIGFRTIDRPTDDTAPPVLGSLVGQSVAAADRTSSGFARAFSLALPDVLFTAEAEYVDQHFLGLGHTLRAPLALGVSTSVPDNGNPFRLIALEPTYSIPRVQPLDAILQFEIFGRFDRVTQIQDYLEFGAGAGLTWPLQQRMTVSLGTRLSGIAFQDPDVPSGDVIDATFYPQVRVTLDWRWDNQDNPLHPTEGFAVSTRFSYIFGFAETDVQVGSTSQEDLNNFLQLEVAGEFALTLPPFGFVLAGLARVGFAFPLGGEAITPLLPLNERFTLGGSNGMRGFQDNAIGRYDGKGQLIPTREVGGNIVMNGSLELRVPLLEDIGLWTVGFLDVGLLALDIDELVAAQGRNVRTSVGVGLRYLVGNQIPIRLDIGFPVPERRTQAPCTLGASCPREEPWRVHFGFLYPF